MRRRAVPGFAFLAIAFAILGVVFLVLGIAQLVRRRYPN